MKDEVLLLSGSFFRDSMNLLNVHELKGEFHNARNAVRIHGSMEIKDSINLKNGCKFATP